MNALLILGASVVPEDARGVAWSRSGLSFGNQHAGVLVGDAVEDHGKQIQEMQRKLNGLKSPTVKVCRALLAGGQAAIDEATFTAWKTKHLPTVWALHPYLFAVNQLKNALVPPQNVARQKVYWKLKWHEGELEKLAPEAPYPHAKDLKEWLVQAFIEQNVSAEEREYVRQIWADMWADVQAALKEIAKNPLSIVPTWMWIVAGLGAVGVGATFVVPPLLAARRR